MIDCSKLVVLKPMYHHQHTSERERERERKRERERERGRERERKREKGSLRTPIHSFLLRGKTLMY